MKPYMCVYVCVCHRGGMNDPASVTITNFTSVGMSGPDVCSLCQRRVDSSNLDPGCHPKLARTSYNQQSPFTPATGMLGSVFALMFTPGPERYVSSMTHTHTHTHTHALVYTHSNPVILWMLSANALSMSTRTHEHVST